MAKIPNKLILKDGEILMKDGTSTQAYLRKRTKAMSECKNQNFKNGDPVVVIPRSTYEALIEDHILLRGFGS